MQLIEFHSGKWRILMWRKNHGGISSRGTLAKSNEVRRTMKWCCEHNLILTELKSKGFIVTCKMSTAQLCNSTLWLSKSENAHIFADVWSAFFWGQNMWHSCQRWGIFSWNGPFSKLFTPICYDGFRLLGINKEGINNGGLDHWIRSRSRLVTA